MAAALAIVDIGIKVLGNLQQGQMESQQAEQDAVLKEEQASITEQQGVSDAARVESVGAEEETAFRKGARFQKGQNILNIARSGVLMEGSPLKVMNEIALETEKEALGIRFGAKQKASDIKYQSLLNARALKTGATQARRAGEFAKTRSYVGGASNLLQGAGQLSGSRKIRKSNPQSLAS
jgi:hypothetical protein